MKQIITLEKEIAFKTMVGEITSISLEPDLTFVNDSEIEGNLIISGTYKMTEASTIEEDFNYKIPVEIMLTNSLEEDKRKVDINNFTYKIVNEESLEVTIELLIEGLEKVELTETEEVDEVEESLEEEVIEETLEDVREEKQDEEIEVLDQEDKEEELEVLETEKDSSLPLFNEEIPSQLIETDNSSQTVDTNNSQVMDSIFSAFSNTPETYSTYSVYILREDDNLEEVINKYKTTREDLEEYNDLDNLKVGGKLIIPTSLEEENET